MELLKIIVCRMLQLLWDRTVYFAQKNSGFGVYFFIFTVIFKDILQSYLSHRPLRTIDCVI